MAKKETYVSQFDDVAVSAEENEMELQLYLKEMDLSQKGDSSANSQKEIVPHKLPNEELYNKYRDEKIANRTLPFLRGLIWRRLVKFGFPIWMIATGAQIVFVMLLIMLELATENYVDASDWGLCVLTCTVGIVLIVTGILMLVLRKKLRHKKFENFNKQLIIVNDHKWECPSCKFLNDRIGHCERCGVRPILIRRKNSRP